MRVHKYIAFAFGAAFGVAVAATAAIIAADSTTPITFKAGDVISADQLNDQFAKIKNVTDGFSSADELIGTWSCTTVSSNVSTSPCVAGWTLAPSGTYYSRTQNVIFAKESSGIYTWSTTSFYPAFCHMPTTTAVSGIPFELLGKRLITKLHCASGGFDINNCPSSGATGISTIDKLGPTRFIWGYSEPASFTTCNKTDLPPAIPTDLTSAFSNGTVTLTWKNNATDQTGFKVAKKTTLTGSYSDVGTPTTATFSEPLTTGTYWYRVRATNANGDSLGSNEVVVTVP